MATALADAHVAAEKRLRELTRSTIERVFDGLGGYDRPQRAEFVRAAVPIVTAAQRQSAALTNAYLARAMERQPLALDFADVTGAAARGGTPLEVVYGRPFLSLWAGLAQGQAYPAAVATARSQASDAAATDVQLTMRATADANNSADPDMYGFTRVADGDACALCQEVDGAYVKDADAMPLHSGCGCSLEANTAPHPRAAYLPSGIAVEQNDEIGAAFVAGK